MKTQRINRISSIALLALSLTAALSVVVAAATVLFSGQAPQPAHDEGTAAHLFQLAVVAAAFSGLVFMLTADWRNPTRTGRPLVVAVVFLAIAFGVLYYFERVLGYL